jgi:hypothetical protein
MSGKCQIRNQTVLKRLKLDLGIYGNNNVTYDEKHNDIIKSDDKDIKLVFKINVIDLCPESVNIGSFIRTAIRLLTKFYPSQILFIIDLRRCCSSIEELSTSKATKKSNKNLQEQISNLVKFIDTLISNSTTSIVFTNVILLVSDCFQTSLEKQFNELEKSCVSIVTEINQIIELKNRIPFRYNSLDAFINFDSKEEFIEMDFQDPNFSIDFAPMIQVLASYTPGYLEKSKDRIFIVCIEKIPNIYRLHGLIKKHKLENKILVCVPEITNNRNNAIPEICDQLNIQHFPVSLAKNFVLQSHQNGKNIVAVDLHDSAITMKYGDRIEALNNSVIIFGFESSGIPTDILSLATDFVQFEAYSSINVIAAVSILFQALYPVNS